MASAFLRACYHVPLTEKDFATALAHNMLDAGANRGAQRHQGMASGKTIKAVLRIGDAKRRGPSRAARPAPLPARVSEKGDLRWDHSRPSLQSG